jgi:hypothetical protein
MIVDAVQQQGKCFLVDFAEEDEAGVGSYRERFFGEAVKIEIHGGVYPECRNGKQVKYSTKTNILQR